MLVCEGVDGLEGCMKHLHLTTKDKWMVILFSPVILLVTYVFAITLVIACPIIFLYNKLKYEPK